MSRFFHWSMRNGAGILFAVALLLVAIGLLQPLYALFATTSEMAGNHYYSPSLADAGMQVQLQLIVNALELAAFPFAAALVVDRLDRHWFGGKSREEGAE